MSMRLWSRPSRRLLLFNRSATTSAVEGGELAQLRGEVAELSRMVSAIRSGGPPPGPPRGAAAAGPPAPRRGDVTARAGSGQVLELRCAGARPGGVQGWAARAGRRTGPGGRRWGGEGVSADMLDLWLAGARAEGMCPCSSGARSRPTGAGSLLEVQ